MKHKLTLALIPLLALSAGCSLFSSEPPAKPSAKKVAPKKPVAQNPSVTQPAAKKTVPGTATYAIDNSPMNFKDEASMPAFRAEPLNPPPDIAPQVQQAPAAGGAPGNVPVAPSVAVPGSQTGLSVPVQPAPLSIVMEEASIPSGTSPAVVALLSDADRSRNRGDLDGAVVVMERALRIDSRNPTITYKLAQLRLKQSKPQMAEELAGKAALLAGGDLDLKRKSWLLIAEARQLQQNYQGAKEAKAKAESFFGR